MILKKNKKFGALRGLALAGAIGACSVGVGSAALVTHNLNYTLTSGTGTLTGSLTFDDSLASQTSSFADVSNMNDPSVSVYLLLDGTSVDGAFSTDAGSIVGNVWQNSAVFDANTDLVAQFDDINFFNNTGSSAAGPHGTDIFTVSAGSSVFVLTSTSVATAAVPEPSSAALLGFGGVALMMRRKK